MKKFKLKIGLVAFISLLLVGYSVFGYATAQTAKLTITNNSSFKWDYTWGTSKHMTPTDNCGGGIDANSSCSVTLRFF